MTRPCSAAVVTSGFLLADAAIAFTFARYVPALKTIGTLLALGGAIALILMWDAPPEEDLGPPAWVSGESVPDYVPAEWSEQ